MTPRIRGGIFHQSTGIMAEASNKGDFVVGVDMGGTKILAGVYDASLECVGRFKMSTKAERGPVEVIERISRCVHDAVDECDLELKRVKAVGVGAPGSVDPENGRVIFAGNLGWKDVALKKELEKRLDLPVFLQNDANLCALGVHEVELEGKPRNMVGIFLGTGIGAGLIIEGKLYMGFNRTAGEVGHMVISVNGPKCSCGNRGCWEALSSRSAIFRQVQEAVEEEAARCTGIAVANLLNILNPEVVVLGGGLMDALENEMLPVIIDSAKEHTMPGSDKGIKIIPSKLGDDAGITGGAVLARRETK
jgi:glucokinase